MNLSAAVVVAVLVVVVECGAYSPTSTKFDWSPNRNSQGGVHKSIGSDLNKDLNLKMKFSQINNDRPLWSYGPKLVPVCLVNKKKLH